MDILSGASDWAVRRIHAAVLNRVIGSFVRGATIAPDDVDISVASGSVRLTSLALEPSAINTFLIGLPFRVRWGSLGTLEAKVSLVGDVPTRVVLHSLELELFGLEESDDAFVSLAKRSEEAVSGVMGAIQRLGTAMAAKLELEAVNLSVILRTPRPVGGWDRLVLNVERVVSNGSFSGREVKFWNVKGFVEGAPAVPRVRGACVLDILGENKLEVVVGYASSPVRVSGHLSPVRICCNPRELAVLTGGILSALQPVPRRISSPSSSSSILSEGGSTPDLDETEAELLDRVAQTVPVRDGLGARVQSVPHARALREEQSRIAAGMSMFRPSDDVDDQGLWADIEEVEATGMNELMENIMKTDASKSVEESVRDTVAALSKKGRRKNAAASSVLHANGFDGDRDQHLGASTIYEVPEKDQEDVVEESEEKEQDDVWETRRLAEATDEIAPPVMEARVVVARVSIGLVDGDNVGRDVVRMEERRIGLDLNHVGLRVQVGVGHVKIGLRTKEVVGTDDLFRTSSLKAVVRLGLAPSPLAPLPRALVDLSVAPLQVDATKFPSLMDLLFQAVDALGQAASDADAELQALVHRLRRAVANLEAHGPPILPEKQVTEWNWTEGVARVLGTGQESGSSDSESWASAEGWDGEDGEDVELVPVARRDVEERVDLSKVMKESFGIHLPPPVPGVALRIRCSEIEFVGPWSLFGGRDGFMVDAKLEKVVVWNVFLKQVENETEKAPETTVVEARGFRSWLRKTENEARFEGPPTLEAMSIGPVSHRVHPRVLIQSSPWAWVLGRDALENATEEEEDEAAPHEVWGNDAFGARVRGRTDRVKEAQSGVRIDLCRAKLFVVEHTIAALVGEKSSAEKPDVGEGGGFVTFLTGDEVDLRLCHAGQNAAILVAGLRYFASRDTVQASVFTVAGMMQRDATSWTPWLVPLAHPRPSGAALMFGSTGVEGVSAQVDGVVLVASPEVVESGRKMAKMFEVILAGEGAEDGKKDAGLKLSVKLSEVGVVLRGRGANLATLAAGVSSGSAGMGEDGTLRASLSPIWISASLRAGVPRAALVSRAEDLVLGASHVSVPRVFFGRDDVDLRDDVDRGGDEDDEANSTDRAFAGEVWEEIRMVEGVAIQAAEAADTDPLLSRFVQIGVVEGFRVDGCVGRPEELPRRVPSAAWANGTVLPPVDGLALGVNVEAVRGVVGGDVAGVVWGLVSGLIEAGSDELEAEERADIWNVEVDRLARALEDELRVPPLPPPSRFVSSAHEALVNPFASKEEKERAQRLEQDTQEVKVRIPVEQAVVEEHFSSTPTAESGGFGLGFSVEDFDFVRRVSSRSTSAALVRLALGTLLPQGRTFVGGRALRRIQVQIGSLSVVLPAAPGWTRLGRTFERLAWLRGGGESAPKDHGGCIALETGPCALRSEWSEEEKGSVRRMVGEVQTLAVWDHAPGSRVRRAWGMDGHGSAIRLRYDVWQPGPPRRQAPERALVRLDLGQGGRLAASAAQLALLGKWKAAFDEISTPSPSTAPTQNTTSHSTYIIAAGAPTVRILVDYDPIMSSDDGGDAAALRLLAGQWSSVLLSLRVARAPLRLAGFAHLDPSLDPQTSSPPIRSLPDLAFAVFNHWTHHLTESQLARTTRDIAAASAAPLRTLRRLVQQTRAITAANRAQALNFLAAAVAVEVLGAAAAAARSTASSTTPDSSIAAAARAIDETLSDLRTAILPPAERRDRDTVFRSRDSTPKAPQNTITRL